MKQNRNVVRLTESKLRNMIKESIKSILKESDGNLEKEFSQWVRMVSTNPQEYGLSYNPMELLRDCYYGIEGNEESYSETDNMIYDMAEDFANYKGVDNDSMIRNAVKNVAYSNQLWESKKNVTRLTESKLNRIVSESVKRILKESVSEFEFGEPRGIRRTGKPGDRDRRLVRRQPIFLNGSEVGRLVTIEGSPEETYYITDADYQPEYTNYIDERPERIREEPDFKKFTNYDEALKYAIDNFETIKGQLAL